MDGDTDIVFDKSIFSSIFYKDIRRVFIYKKAEQLASALYLIAPAFSESVSLKTRTEVIAVALTEAACLPGTRFGAVLSRELLALSSVLTMARVGGLLSVMNANLIAREARSLLADVAAYEEPRLALAESPNLAAMARQVPRAPLRPEGAPTRAGLGRPGVQGQASTRQASILALLKDKDKASIKDIALVVRGISEKTIQREIQGLIDAGKVRKQGERRWSTYELAR